MFGNGSQPPSGFSYHGEGLVKGQCGITLERVVRLDRGVWNCMLITHAGDTLVGEVQVEVAGERSDSF